MEEGSLKLKELERGHRRKSFFQWFSTCLRLKKCFKSALLYSKVCAKSVHPERFH